MSAQKKEAERIRHKVYLKHTIYCHVRGISMSYPHKVCVSLPTNVAKSGERILIASLRTGRMEALARRWRRRSLCVSLFQCRQYIDENKAAEASSPSGTSRMNQEHCIEAMGVIARRSAVQRRSPTGRSPLLSRLLTRAHP